MAAEHWRPGGLSQGYFCNRCGQVCNMYGTGHGPNMCPPNPILVDILIELNTVEAEERREFLKSLKNGKAPEGVCGGFAV